MAQRTTWDISQYIAQARQNNAEYVTLVLDGPQSTDPMARFRSKDAGAATAPQLLVTADPTPQPPAAPSNLTAAAASSSQVIRARWECGRRRGKSGAQQT